MTCFSLKILRKKMYFTSNNFIFFDILLICSSSSTKKRKSNLIIELIKGFLLEYRLTSIRSKQETYIQFLLVQVFYLTRFLSKIIQFKLN